MALRNMIELLSSLSLVSKQRQSVLGSDMRGQEVTEIKGKKNAQENLKGPLLSLKNAMELLGGT